MTTEPDDGTATQISDDKPYINIPGRGKLREAVASYATQWLPGKTKIRRDGIADRTIAIANVPDGMSNRVLAGVYPIYGKYASVAGPIVGGIFTSTMLMVVTNTSASALVPGHAINGESTEHAGNPPAHGAAAHTSINHGSKKSNEVCGIPVAAGSFVGLARPPEWSTSI